MPGPRKATVVRVSLAVVTALLVGTVMAGGATLFGLQASEVELIGVLGGIGAAGFVLFFTGVG